MLPLNPTRLRIWRRKAWGFESPLSHRNDLARTSPAAYRAGSGTEYGTPSRPDLSVGLLTLAAAGAFGGRL